MRIYEELFIIRPDATEEEIDQVVTQMTQVITDAGGTVDKLEKWGIRKLAYTIAKRDEGFYVLIQFQAGPLVVRELERRLRVSDAVIKYLTVRIDEHLKAVEKKRKQREERAKRRPAPAAAMPAMPALPALPALPSEPETPRPGVAGEAE